MGAAKAVCAYGPHVPLVPAARLVFNVIAAVQHKRLLSAASLGGHKPHIRKPPAAPGVIVARLFFQVITAQV